MQHGVSRTPVREALRQLAMSGLIEMRPRKGAIVAKVSPGQLEDMFVAMAEMEATSARLAAMSMTPIERRRLQARHDAMVAMVRANDVPAYTAANDGFHSAIYAGAHNPPLAEFTAALRRRLAPFRRAQFQTEAACPAPTRNTNRSFARSWPGMPPAPTPPCCITSAWLRTLSRHSAHWAPHKPFSTTPGRP